MFMLFITLYAMIIKMVQFYKDGNVSLFVIGLVILIMTFWLIIEAFLLYLKDHRKRVRAKKAKREVFDISSD